MKILIVTHYFPPYNSIASLRPYSWAKYWSCKGNEVTVLTTRKETSETDLALDCTGFKVVPVDFLKEYGFLSKRYRFVSPTRPKGIDKVKKYTLGARIKKYIARTGTVGADCRLPNLYQLWVNKAIKRIKEENTVYDVVVGSFAPFAALAIAIRLKEQGIARKSVLDFRDLWVENHIFKGLPLVKVYEKELERKFCTKADLITTVSDPLARILHKKYGDKVAVILNGFDAKEPIKATSSGVDNTYINLLYTGFIYEGHQDPSPLFKAVEMLKQENCEFLSRLRILFVGWCADCVSKLLNVYPIGEYVQCEGFLPREQCILMQRDADILLFLDDKTEAGDGILTGKLFEYMFSGSFIWSIGGRWQPSEMIEKHRIGKAFGMEADSIKNELKKILSGKKVPKNDVACLSQLKVYTREYQVNRMLSLLMGK